MGLQQFGRLTFAAITVAFALICPGAHPAYAAPENGIDPSAETIQIPGSSVVVTLWQDQDGSGNQAHFYRITLDGDDVARQSKAAYELGLGYGAFDPLDGELPIDPTLLADASGHLFIVQFVTPPLVQYADQIAALGGLVHHYIAQYAYLVEMDATTREAVDQLPYVRWVGPYHPAYRLEGFLIENLARAEQVYPRETYNIQVMTEAQKQRVADRLALRGYQVDSADAGKFLVRATLTPDQLFDVTHWDEVLFADRWGPYEHDMNIIRVMTGADYIETMAGYTGAGVRGESFDAGFNIGHHDFESRPLIQHGSTGSDSHGAATSGICFGDGAGQAIARGLLPDGQGIVADYHYAGLTGVNRYQNSMELLEEPYEAVFQTSSVGSPRTYNYSTISADTDAMLFDSDLVHCQSQSNAGTQDSRPQAWAKNIISGGGIYHYGSADLADDCWCYGASIGPASDGRIKPTLCHAYDQTYTVDCCGYESYTPIFGGTSGATPIIAGHVGLFHQMWAEGIFGNEVDPEGSVFDNRPHSATAKAMMVNTARQYDFSGTTHDKTRMHQGWGLPDLQNLYDLREKFYVVDQGDLLRPFDIREHTVLVEEDEPALKVTLAYPDLPGNPAVQTQHRINDLTLRVISPSETVYYGNEGLLEGVWSTPGGAADTKNTVECVFVQNPEAGEWTIEVRADELVQDAAPATIMLDAPYALVASGVRSVDYSDVDRETTARRSALSLVLDGPNPNSRTAHFTYALSAARDLRLTVHDAQGRRVATLFEGVKATGTHQAAWDARGENGAPVAPGVYFIRLMTEREVATEKLLLVK